jgi:hypothetical protein
LKCYKRGLLDETRWRQQARCGALQLGRQDVADEYELLLNYFPNLD